ncbi:MAG: hypothetical protein R2911_35950 [Caldilineaceae bacterium]
MQEGARTLTPFVHEYLAAAAPARSLGLGWLGAYLLLSGSPVAAAALTFFDAGALDAWSTFMMITGSRLGASLTVFFLGFLYVLRGRNRADSLSMGLLSLSVTGVTHFFGIFVGLALLHGGWLDRFQLRSGYMLSTLFERIFAPLAHALAEPFPVWASFFLGLAIILVSFNFFDRALPQMAIKESHVGQVAQFVYRPWVMLALGAGITLISMSVTVSLGILVPLNDRGFIRRENVIPYMMGANITTFIDTLLAAVLLDNPAAFTVVMAEMVSIALISTLILLTAYRRFEMMLLGFVTWTTASNRNLTLFVLSIVLVPFALILL